LSQAAARFFTRQLGSLVARTTCDDHSLVQGLCFTRATAPRALPAAGCFPHAPAMFVVTEADGAAIRAVYEQCGEFAAAVELWRLFPGVTDSAQARACARTIAGWKPLPLRPVKRTPRLRRMR
jgi:hypothetical protein